MKYVYSDDVEIDIIEYLKRDLGKNKIKTYVKLGFVKVNNKKIKLPYKLKKGDFIEIIKEEVNDSFDIVYEDKNYLVVNKKEGLLTISTSSKNKQIEDTLYKRVRKYLNDKKERVFIVNRIDKETSGLVIFAKNEKLKNMLQDNWNNIVKKRGYIAVVSGNMDKGRIENYLYEDKNTFVHSTNKGGKLAITNYNPIKKNDKYTMLDINIETGRKNQIRVHMSEAGHPIVGDKKYKCFSNQTKRLMLHHYEICLIDPITKKEMKFTSDIPKIFNSLFN